MINNHYGMTAPTRGRHRLRWRRAAGFADNNLNAEVVNGMDILAPRRHALRGGSAAGRGPV